MYAGEKRKGERKEIASRRGAWAFTEGNRCRDCGSAWPNFAARRRHERKAHRNPAIAAAILSIALVIAVATVRTPHAGVPTAGSGGAAPMVLVAVSARDGHQQNPSANGRGAVTRKGDDFHSMGCPDWHHFMAIANEVKALGPECDGLVREDFVNVVYRSLVGRIPDIDVHIDDIGWLVDTYYMARARLAQESNVKPDGTDLFNEVRELWKDRIAFDAEWAYDIAALAVMQRWATPLLDTVFYPAFSDTKGKGKSTALKLFGLLTNALKASDISPAALVHWLKEHPGGAVTIDEFDVKRDAERDSALQAVVRTGYEESGKYTRWDPVLKKLDECPTFGVKALGFRGTVDEALADRMFVLPLKGGERGRNGAKLVMRNRSPLRGNLVARLASWGQHLSEAVTEEDWEGEAWLSKVEEVLGKENIGANRETQLTDVAMRVCRLVNVDLTESLRAAFDIRRAVAAANTDIGIEDALDVLASFKPTRTVDRGARFIVVLQKEFMEALNVRRAGHGLRPLRNGATVRNDLGIRPTWLTYPKNRVVWNIPETEWRQLVEGRISEEAQEGGG